MVEVPGVEPGSEVTVQRTSTHIVDLFILTQQTPIDKILLSQLDKVFASSTQALDSAIVSKRRSFKPRYERI